MHFWICKWKKRGSGWPEVVRAKKVSVYFPEMYQKIAALHRKCKQFLLSVCFSGFRIEAVPSRYKDADDRTAFYHSVASHGLTFELGDTLQGLAVTWTMAIQFYDVLWLITETSLWPLCYLLPLGISNFNLLLKRVSWWVIVYLH